MGSLLPVWPACQHSARVPGRWSGERGVTGKPVFHLLLKPFILRTPKKLVLGAYGNGWHHTRSSLFLEGVSLLSAPSWFFLFSFLFLFASPPCLFLLSLIRSQLQSLFLREGRSVQPEDTQMTHRTGILWGRRGAASTLMVPDTGQCLALNR